MSRRSTLAAFVLASVLALGGLLAAAATDRRDTAFSLGVADNVPVASLAHGRTLCQGPFIVRVAFSALQMWVRPAHALEVEIRSASSRRVLVARQITTSPTLTGELTIPLGTTTIQKGTRITVCVRNAGPDRVAFEGGRPTRNSGRFEISGAPTRNSGGFEISGRHHAKAIALLFLRPHPPALLSLLPAVFQRASLFKPAWVGAWTFWALGAAMICAFALAAAAVADATRAEAAQDGD
ncbi:MAG: hypothetical protein WCB67_06740 [Solirubrobacteraceae bacterium]